uniref:RAI1-like domain-containing protein n=1 Tax=Trypanosoma congolense (strain IL3000) TaxID=1068625 RepID=G0US56_TRYCI|nr:conserved hypothetical protein [Trypanosoma congolense IL3000]
MLTEVIELRATCAPVLRLRLLDLSDAVTLFLYFSSFLLFFFLIIFLLISALRSNDPMPSVQSGTLSGGAKDTVESKNGIPLSVKTSDRECCDTGDAFRPSRRKLHRQAVKKFNDKRKHQESKRLAEERDEKLLAVVDRSGELPYKTGCHSAHVSATPIVRKVDDYEHSGDASHRCAWGHPVLGKWDFDFFFRTVPSELLRTCNGVSDVEGPLQQRPMQEAAPVPALTSSNVQSDEEQPLVLLENSRERLLRGTMPLKAGGQSGVLRGSFVRRVEGVPSIPMHMPLEPGTDLDKPTCNYLTPDPTYNIHQYVPGFGRDELAAKRSLLSCAVREWRNGGDKVLVLSTGEALRSVFEATYNDDRTLALQVRRVGPTLLVDSHSEQVVRAGVQDMRMKSLLAKALYRILEGSTSQCDLANGGVVNPGNQGVVTMPMHRIGSAALTRRVRELSRYSHILHWEIGTMDALVGADTPVVLDVRSNMEHVLCLRDTSVAKTPKQLQRDVLNSWFEATLANVPNVGVYVHHDGIIEGCEVVKTQEILGLVEGRMAATAMNFTTSVLQWLVKQCRRDGATYAVIQNYESGALEIYECFNDEELERFLPEDGTSTEDGRHASATEASRTQAEEDGRQQEEENERLNWGLATMCFRMGMHLKDSVEKAPDAMSLLLRSFLVYLMQRKRMDEACPHICEILKVLPELVGLVIRNKKANLESEGGVIQLPEICREVFITCGRFGTRLHEVAFDESLHVPIRRSFLQCLLPCSAAVCVCVARAAEQFHEERSTYLRQKAESGKCSNVHIHGLIAKGLLQMVVEGLLRLENMISVLESGMEIMHCAPVYEMVKENALIDTKTDIMDVAPLVRALREFYADIALLAMSDPTPFTANILVELSHHIKARGEARNRAADVPTPVGASASGESVLAWMSTITYDVVSLSYTALRFLTKVGVQSKRILAKTAQVYYHVGHHYLLTDRYTKALDSLHRAQSLFKGTEDGEVKGIFGEHCASSAGVKLEDVRYSLGETFLRMANLKLRLTPASCTLTPQQPLAMGDARPLSPEEDSFYRQAVDHFEHCGARDKLAFVFRMYACRQISHIISCGHQADSSKGRSIYSLLKRADELQPCPLLRWEVLRLFGCVAPHGALQRWAEELYREWGGCAASSGAEMVKELTPVIHPLEYGLQMALVAVGCAELKRNAKEHRSMGFTRSWAAYLGIVLNSAQERSGNEQEMLKQSLALWKAPCVHEWVYHIAMLIAIRGTGSALRLATGSKATPMKTFLKQLCSIKEKFEEQREVSSAGACDGGCYCSREIASLVRALETVAAW